MTEHISEIESRCMENDICLAEPANAFAVSEILSSAIEFYVRSDEGIDLHVDLNSSPSDWAERIRNEVCICASFFRDNCQSLQQNLGWFKGHREITSSFQWDNHAGPSEGDYMGIKSPPSSNQIVNNLMEIDQPDEADLSAISSAILSHTFNVDASEHLNEDQTFMSPEANFNVQIPNLSASEICATTEDKRATTLDFDTNYSLVTKTNCDPISRGNSTLQDSCSIMNLSVGYPESSVAGSLEMQSSCIEQCPKDVLCSPGEDSKNVDYSFAKICRKAGSEFMNALGYGGS